jgi:hypothetical protein
VCLSPLLLPLKDVPWQLVVHTIIASATFYATIHLTEFSGKDYYDLKSVIQNFMPKSKFEK